MSKKFKIILIILLIAIVVTTGYVYFQNWWQMKQLKIERGLASDKFPWRDYTLEELNKLYPQIKYADVPTRVTPEETYAKFREALRTNNLEMALGQLAKEGKNYKANKEALEKAYKEGKFSDLFGEYLEKLEKSYMYESIAQYYFIEKKDGKTTNYPMGFLKDANGDWGLDSL